MILLTVSNLRKHYGPQAVLDGVTFDIRAGQRIALVGPNGAGKTTLLRILAGHEEADGGSAALANTARLGYLQQQPDFASGQTVWQEALHALAHLIDLGRQAELLSDRISHCQDETERRRLGRQFDHLQHQLQLHDAYHLDHKIERILAGLGFPSDCFQQPVEQLSGGQKNRLLLAKLLLAEPDLMLLDEPSNHLDIEATHWLERYLAQVPSAMILVSHDRYLMDKVATDTMELLHGTVDQYSGNFTAYRRQKSERLEVQRRTYEKQQSEIAKLDDFVRRHHYGQKHAQAEDRRKKLERIERVQLPREITVPPMGFPPAARSGDVALRVEHLSKAFDRPLFQDLSFDILRGQKWGVLGPNGSGKTTLLRCLLNDRWADQGNVIFASGVKVGYFDQLLECVDSQQLVLDAVRPSHKEFVEQQRRDLLARFGISGDMVFQRVDQLSGGERNRVALARLAASDANFLILDEPTNHLDLWARDALERALTAFQGSVLFVSHDRYFINQVADHLLVVDQAGFRVIEGDYDTYLYLTERFGDGRGDSSDDARQVVTKNRQRSKKDPAGQDIARRKRRFPYRKVEDLERDIHDCELRIAQLHQSLADPDVLRDGRRVKQATADLEAQQQQLSALMEHWEEACELN